MADHALPLPFHPAAAPRRRRHPFAAALALLVAAAVLAPVAALALVALGGDGSDWPHLLRNVLPGAARTTLALLLMVAAGTATVGVGAAWLVTGHDFPLRRPLAAALVLPLAVPPYLAAYAAAEFFGFTGPVQGALRALTGAASARDYWFPEIRSTGGAALVLTSVLFPYVYLAARVVFLLQGRHVADVARTLGARPAAVFWRVALPVARPAVAAGTVLALMETLNDVGASEYLGVRTMTFAVFSTWLNRGSLEGAAQLALVMLLLVLALVSAERWARRERRFGHARSSHMSARGARVPLRGARGAGAALLLLAPVALGFGVPLGVFGRFALHRLDQLLAPELREALATTVAVAGVSALLATALALFVVGARRLLRTGTARLLGAVAALGYALPGTVLGLGLLLALTRFDNAVDALARSTFGLSTGLFLSGSILAVVIACTIRFLAIAEGTLRAGAEKLPAHLDDAARSLGRAPAVAAATILLPLLRPAILSAFILVFVDTAKELSATILLRPFGFGTLATLAYENASRGAVEDGAWAALLIIATALVPVALLSGALLRDRAG